VAEKGKFRGEETSWKGSVARLKVKWRGNS